MQHTNEYVQQKQNRNFLSTTIKYIMKLIQIFQYYIVCISWLLQRKGKKKMTLTISKGGIRIVDDATKVGKKPS